MVDNQKTEWFQLKVSNMIAMLKFFGLRGVISYPEHFKLWTRLLRIETNEELDKFVAEVRELVEKKKSEWGEGSL